MNKLSIILFHTFFILISKCQMNNFICRADKIKVNLLNLNSTEKEEKRRLAAEYSPIKIVVDYSNFGQPSSMKSDNFNKMKVLIEDTITEFKKFLRVQHYDIDLSGQEDSIKQSCNIISISSSYANYLKDNDVIVFAKFNSELEQKDISAAKLCLTQGNRPRPIAGVLEVNPNFDFSLENNDLFIKQILFHEISHILIFDKNLLKQLGMLTTKNSRQYITSSRVLSNGKRHFNCSSLSGLPLEDQLFQGNPPGTHWDARYMLGDYMITQFYPDMVLSDITLALFEDALYYKVDYYSGGLFKFGKNKGCNFLNKNCIENGEPLFEEFCSSFETPLCSSTRITKGSCIINDYINYNISVPSKYQYFENPNHGGNYFTDFCPVADIPQNQNNYFPTHCKVGNSALPPEFGEEMSDTSFCFLSSLTPPTYEYYSTTRAMCYKVECHKDTEQIIVNVGTTTFICPTNGGIVSGSGFKGVLTCPKYYDICDTDSNQLCNNIFDCLNKKIEVNDDSYIMPGNISFDKYIPYGSSKCLKMNILAFLIIFLLIF